jgi:glycerol-3-phosphate acyltransferase PlsY
MPSAENDRGAASSGFEPSLGSCNIGQEFLQRRGLCLPNRRDSSFEIHSAFTKMTEIVIVLASYFLGSVPSGFILGSMAGVDVRKMGSGNVGATNVARVLGKGRGALTLAADVLKGWLPVFVAHQLELNLLAVCAAGLAAFFGHIYSVFLRFRGGKGVATAFGVLLGVAPAPTAVSIVVFAGVFGASRLVSLGSIAAAVAAPISAWIMGYRATVVIMIAVMTFMITWRHRANIERLRAGTEPKFGSASSR